jgi:hypothetical protein
VTLLTDDMLCQSRALEVLESRYIMGWLLECREYRGTNYQRAEELLPQLDLLLTHDADLLERFPEKCRFVPFGGSWISEPGFRPKTRFCSMIYSAKRFMPGHRLRHEIAASARGVDLFGRGTANPIENKEMGLDFYRFSIAVENSRAPNYFTEKLLDCFATGTIPIYWGCPNIGDWFNPDGIITFNSAADIPAILESAQYEKLLPAARDNLERMLEFEITDDWIYHHVLREFE